MITDSPTWRLYSSTGQLVAEIDETEREGEVIGGSVRAFPALEPLRPLFKEFNEIIESDDEAAMRVAYDRVRAEVDLTGPDGTVVPHYLLVMHDDKAMFQLGDPFRDDN